MELKNKVLTRLEENRGEFISGESLSKEFDVTRQAVWKAVQKLTSEGYTVRSVTNKGYMLDGKCDLISSTVISKNTATRVLCYDEVASTNDVAKKEYFCDGDCLVVAERQSAGRKKNGEDFLSPKNKGIYMTIATSAHVDLRKSEDLRGRIARCVADKICDSCGNMPDLRNVDELYLNGKKICGILLEGVMNVADGMSQALFIGIGIYTANVNETLGYIDSLDTRNELISEIYKGLKNLLN